MTIHISDYHQQLIAQRIAAGEFRTVEEAVEAALEHWTTEHGDFAPGELDRLIRPAMEQFDRGEGIPLDQAMQTLREDASANMTKRTNA